MSETAFRIFNRLFTAGAQLLYAGLLTAFLCPFLAGGDRKGLRRLAVFGGYLLLALLCCHPALPQGAFGLPLAALLPAASRRLGLTKPLAFLLALLYLNARACAGLMAESLYFIAQRLLPLRLEPLESVYLRSAVFILLFLLCHALLVAAMLYLLVRRLKKQRLPVHPRELRYLGLMPVGGILLGQVVSRLLIEVHDGVLCQLYERHPAFLAAVPLLALLFYAGGYLAIACAQGMASLREEQAAHYIEYQQVQALRARIQEAEQLYAQARGFRHELRGHLTNIQGLARSGAYASLNAYIAQMDGSIRDFELAMETGNPVTDVIISDKKRQCQDLGIAFQVDFHCPQEGAFDGFDLGIILQNLLQNAVEACEGVEAGRRFIQLSGRGRGRFFLIEVKNPFAGTVAFGPDGLPLTGKQGEGCPHGIGLGNVRQKAEKYMGELELAVNGQEFSAAVLLQERSSL